MFQGNSKTQESIYEELKKLANKDNPFARRNEKYKQVRRSTDSNINKSYLQSKINEKVISLMNVQDAVEILQLKEASSKEIEKVRSNKYYIIIHIKYY